MNVTLEKTCLIGKLALRRTTEEREKSTLCPEYAIVMLRHEDQGYRQRADRDSRYLYYKLSHKSSQRLILTAAHCPALACN